MNEKGKTLAELARMVGGDLVGDQEIVIESLADLASAGAGQITFLVKKSQAASLTETKAAAIIVPLAVDSADKPLIRVKDPYMAAAVIQNYFLQKPFQASGIHTTAHIGNDCNIPGAVSIGPMVAIGDRVKLGERVTIKPGVVVGNDVEIGDDSILFANVTIYHSCTIGKRVQVHSGTVIGGDGFGFATDEQGNHVKWPHTGTVQIDDDVDIGANVTIDRATFGKTHIMQGARIDNLVTVAHNVKIGVNSVVVAQVGIAGSASLGRNVVLGGQVGVKGHIHLDDGVMVAAKSGVHNNQQKGSIIAGIPAIPHKNWLKASMLIGKLPEMFKDIRSLKSKISQIYTKLFPDGPEV
jgi:UDP-3-O-[3-hydroxymyristoyl] glucosamine N-acyltransferase